MRKLAMLAVGTTFAAGLVLVPAAGAATAATAGPPVTDVQPRVSLYDCVISGGQVREIEPGLGICVGGALDGQPVWW
ncbi:hypothetical protein ABH926_008875 [Catenulispora sp. GP43]|uniref:hypothetical protein n=1 Tax=Catenulispora sp. GP43 TaxID=3156263 RepID=UPI003512C799